MKSAVIVALVEFVQSKRDATPNDPTFQIGFLVIVNEVVGPAEPPAPKRKNVFLKDHWSCSLIAARCGCCRIEQRSQYTLQA